MDNHTGHSGLTLRAVLSAILITLFIGAGSSYVALKMGMLPWPIILSVIAVTVVMKIGSRHRPSNLHEMNIAQAGGTIGGLVAAGLAFTLPGIHYLNQTRHLGLPFPNNFTLSVLAVGAGLFGVLLSIPLKRLFVDEEALPYPAGMAGAEILKSSVAGGREVWLLLMVGSLVAAGSLLRDVTIPQGFLFAPVASLGIVLVLYPSPLAASVGYFLGHRAGVTWFLGALCGTLLLPPLDVGMGLVVGSGLGFLIAHVLPHLKRFLSFFVSWRRAAWVLVMALFAAGILKSSGVSFSASVLTVVASIFMVAVAARMTGATNVNPLEQFGIFVAVVIALIFSWLHLPLGPVPLFLIVAFVSIACAVAGDVGHDFKSASLLGTRWQDIVVVDTITACVAGLSVPWFLDLVMRGFSHELFTAAMPAPQSQLVAGSIMGFAHPHAFLVGFAVGGATELVNRLLVRRGKPPLLAMPFGIGLFLGLGMAIPLVVGSILAFLVQKKSTRTQHVGMLIAASVMGGESTAGFLAGSMTTFGIAYTNAVFLLMGIFVCVGGISLWIWGRWPKRKESGERQTATLGS